MVVILDKQLKQEIEEKVAKIPIKWVYDDVAEIYVPEIVINEVKEDDKRAIV